MSDLVQEAFLEACCVPVPEHRDEGPSLSAGGTYYLAEKTITITPQKKTI